MRPFALPRVADLLLALGLVFMPTAKCAADKAIATDDMSGVQALLVTGKADITMAIPAHSRLLISPESIEAFLETLDHTMPDWRAVHGAGHHDAGLDDRLFQLNRERDERRKDNEALTRRITFCWSGTLARYDPERGGFPVAVGPKFTTTAWGVVRFKPEDLPSNLTATAAPSLRDQLVNQMNGGKSLDLTVAMTGHLIPEESVIYDFSHEEEGQGLIMPVVRVEHVQYFLIERE
jgi:hypothetical protein